MRSWRSTRTRTRAGRCPLPTRPPSGNVETYWRLPRPPRRPPAVRSTTFEELCPAGVVAPPHIHDNEEEAFFVLEGDLTFLLDDQETFRPARNLCLHRAGHPARVPLRLRGGPGVQHPDPGRIRPRHHRKLRSRNASRDAAPGCASTIGYGANSTEHRPRPRWHNSPDPHRQIIAVDGRPIPNPAPPQHISPTRSPRTLQPNS